MTVYTFFITSLAVRLASTEPYNLILPPYSYLFAILHADYMYLHMYTQVLQLQQCSLNNDSIHSSLQHTSILWASPVAKVTQLETFE